MAIRAQRIATILAAAAVLLGLPCTPASAASPRAGWIISSIAQPSSFSADHNAECEEGVGHFVAHVCDSYTLVATNVGGASTSGTVEVNDAVPAGLHVVEVSGVELSPDAGSPSPMTCTATPVRCIYESEVPATGSLVMMVKLVPEGAPRSVTDFATVSGGGTVPATTGASASATQPNTIGAQPAESPAPFGLTSLGFTPTDERARSTRSREIIPTS